MKNGNVKEWNTDERGSSGFSRIKRRETITQRPERIALGGAFLSCATSLESG
jgi:hypothetical protein